LGWSKEKLKSLETEIGIFSDCMSDLHKRGVRVLPGGDYGAFITSPQGENAKDLEIFTELFGFTPMDVIVAATRHGADLMGMGGETGQVRPGFLADLVVLDGDPIADIRIFQDPEKIVGVMKGGVFARRQAALSRASGPMRKTA